MWDCNHQSVECEQGLANEGSPASTPFVQTDDAVDEVARLLTKKAIKARKGGDPLRCDLGKPLRLEAGVPYEISLTEPTEHFGWLLQSMFERGHLDPSTMVESTTEARVAVQAALSEIIEQATQGLDIFDFNVTVNIAAETGGETRKILIATYGDIQSVVLKEDKTDTAQLTQLLVKMMFLRAGRMGINTPSRVRDTHTYSLWQGCESQEEFIEFMVDEMGEDPSEIESMDSVTPQRFDELFMNWENARIAELVNPDGSLSIAGHTMIREWSLGDSRSNQLIGLIEELDLTIVRHPIDCVSLNLDSMRNEDEFCETEFVPSLSICYGSDATLDHYIAAIDECYEPFMNGGGVDSNFDIFFVNSKSDIDGFLDRIQIFQSTFDVFERATKIINGQGEK